MPKKPSAKRTSPKHPRRGAIDWLPDDVLEASGCTRLPIVPESIAEHWDIGVEGRPLNGVSGCLLMHDNNFTIGYSTTRRNEGFQNFTVSHELGHYFTPRHIELLFSDGNGIHQSRSGFVSNQKIEREADKYAVKLLMPKALFRPAMRRCGAGLTAIKTLAAKCKTSLTSTAIRYATLSSAPVIVIISSSGVVDYCAVSPSLRSNCNGFLLKGTPVSRDTLAWEYARFPDKVLRCVEEEGESQLSTWFATAPADWFIEEAIGLGRYEKVLSVLSLE